MAGSHVRALQGQPHVGIVTVIGPGCDQIDCLSLLGTGDRGGGICSKQTVLDAFANLQSLLWKCPSSNLCFLAFCSNFCARPPETGAPAMASGLVPFRQLDPAAAAAAAPETGGGERTVASAAPWASQQGIASTSSPSPPALPPFLPCRECVYFFCTYQRQRGLHSVPCPGAGRGPSIPGAESVYSSFFYFAQVHYCSYLSVCDTVNFLYYYYYYF